MNKILYIINLYLVNLLFACIKRTIKSTIAKFAHIDVRLNTSPRLGEQRNSDYRIIYVAVSEEGTRQDISGRTKHHYFCGVRDWSCT